MENNNIVTEELVEETIESGSNGLLKYGIGLGLGLVAVGAAYKYVIKPFVSKRKEEKLPEGTATEIVSDDEFVEV